MYLYRKVGTVGGCLREREREGGREESELTKHSGNHAEADQRDH